MRQRKTDRQTKEVSQEHVEREKGGGKRGQGEKRVREREEAEKVRGGKQPLL